MDSFTVSAAVEVRYSAFPPGAKPPASRIERWCLACWLADQRDHAPAAASHQATAGPAPAQPQASIPGMATKPRTGRPGQHD